MRRETKTLTWASGATVSNAVDVPVSALDGVGLFISKSGGAYSLTLQASRDSCTTEYIVWTIDVDTARAVEPVPLVTTAQLRQVDLTPALKGLQGQQVRLTTGALGRIGISGYWEFIHKD